MPHEARTPVVTAPLSPRWATVAVAALGSVEVEGAPKEGSSPLAEASGAQGPERLGELARCLLPKDVWPPEPSPPGEHAGPRRPCSPPHAAAEPRSRPCVGARTVWEEAAAGAPHSRCGGWRSSGDRSRAGCDPRAVHFPADRPCWSGRSGWRRSPVAPPPVAALGAPPVPEGFRNLSPV